ERRQSIGEAGFAKDEVRHQAEDGSAKRITLGSTVDGSDFGAAGSADPIGSLDEGDLVSRPAEVVSGYQTIDAAAHHDHSARLHRLPGGRDLTGRPGNTPSTTAPRSTTTVPFTTTVVIPVEYCIASR